MSKTAVQDESALMKTVLDSLTDGVVVANQDGKFLFFNAAAERLLGLGAQDVTPSDWPTAYGCFMPDKTTPFPADRLPLKRALVGEEVPAETIFIRNPQKPSGLWISVCGKPLTDSTGSVRGGLAIFRDTSSQMEAEARLQTTALRFSAVVDNQEAAILVENEKRQIQLVNAAFCRLFGIDEEPSELIGQNCADAAACAKHEFPDPDSFVSRVELIMQRRELVTNERLRLRDGRVVARDYIPVVADGYYLGHVWQYRDMTDREVSIQRTRQVERLSQALAQTADSVVITDKQGRIEYVNDAFEHTTGFTREEAVGQTPRILRSGKHDAQFYRHLWSRIMSGESFRGTIVNRKKTGELYWAEQSITPVKDDNGAITHFVSVLKDVTELLRKKEQELQMRVAREVQQTFYEATTNLPGFDIAGATILADETGGDYYDLIPVSEDRLLIATGDVSGHGISSALIMSETRAYVRAMASISSDPGDILTRVNDMLRPDLRPGWFVTLFLLCLDPRQRSFTFASAGHEYGYVLSPSGAVDAVLKSTGLPLGLFRETLYQTGKPVTLRSEQTVLLLTDGISDCINPADQRFQSARAVEYAGAHRHLPARRIAEGLCTTVRAFSADRGLLDDVTAVVIRAS